MHRARQRLLRRHFTRLLPFFAGAIAAGAALLSPSSSSAFHSGSVFDKPPGAGGGGGIFYTGAPLEHGWKCTLCHEEPPGNLLVRMTVDPPELFDTFVVTPGATYSFTATLDGEALGLSSPLSNYNAIAIAITDTKGFPAGAISGFVPEDFYSGGPTTIVSAGQKVGQTQWTFSYTAPSEPVGQVLIHVAAVDGNGADSPPTETLTDPFGDDVFTATITLESGAMAEAPVAPSRQRGALVLATALALVIAQRRRRAFAATAR